MAGTPKNTKSLFNAGVFLAIAITAPSATAQLSRARSAVRRSAPPLPAPTVAKADAEIEPAPVEVTPAATPDPRPPRRPASTVKRATPTTSTPTPNPPAIGRLQQARQKVRRPEPLSLPAKPAPGPQPPVARPKPVRHQPAPQRRHQHRCNTVPLFVPSHSTHTVILESPAPPPIFAPSSLVTEPMTIPNPTCQEQPPLSDQLSPQEALPIPSSQNTQPPYVTASCLQPLRFADFPYAHGLPGIMARGLHKEWSGSVLFEYGSNFDRLDRRGFGFLAEHSSRFGIDMKWDSYVEDLQTGFTDELHFTDINVLFRVAQSEHYIVRAGLGANILGDAFATDGGFNVTAKIDLFPLDPLVLSGELDLGTIGDAETLHLQGKVGLMFDRFEVFGGYDYRTIGSVPLQGAMLGVQIWF